MVVPSPPTTTGRSFLESQHVIMLPSGSTAMIVLGPLISRWARDSRMRLSTLRSPRRSASAKGSGVMTCLKYLRGHFSSRST